MTAATAPADAPRTSATGDGAGGGSVRRRRESRWALGFLSPMLILVGIFVIFPIGYAGYLSLLRWTGGGPQEFVGLDNYRQIVSDSLFWHAVLNNVIIAIVAIVTQIFLGLVLAYCLVRIVPGVKRTYMFCYMVPVVVSEICIALLWSFIFNPSFGMVNAFLEAIGLDSLTHGWLGDQSTAFAAVLVVMSFTYLGLYVLLFVSAMQNVPEDLYEAARLDGAGNVRMFFSITMPAISDSIQSTTLLAIINSFKTFTLVYVLTGGGPNHATEVVSTLLYKTGFISFDQGYAATIGFTQMILTAIAGLLVFRLLRRKPRKGAAR